MTSKKRYTLRLKEEVIKAVDEEHNNRSAFVERAIIHDLAQEKALEFLKYIKYQGFPKKTLLHRENLAGGK